MLEFVVLSEVSPRELMLGIFFVLISLLITIYIYKMNRESKFVWGFGIITLWNVFELFDEFFIKGIEREIIFNIGGRIVLIVGILFLMFALKSFLGLAKKGVTK